jgi:hypothetical protein
MNRYFLTDDQNVANSLDMKALDRYLKTVEMLYKLDGDRNKSKTPSVGLNLGDGGVTVTRLGNNTVEITPKNKEKTVAEMLQELADHRREQENSSQTDIERDINEEVTQKGESSNES